MLQQDVLRQRQVQNALVFHLIHDVNNISNEFGFRNDLPLLPLPYLRPPLLLQPPCLSKLHIL